MKLLRNHGWRVTSCQAAAVFIDAARVLWYTEFNVIGGEVLNRRCAVFSVLVGAILWVQPASASDWNRYKGDCDQVLKTHRTVLLKRLKECVGLWMAYVDPKSVRVREQQALKESFQSLHSRGINRSDRDAENLAVMAADRLGVTLNLKLRSQSTVSTSEKTSVSQQNSPERRRSKGGSESASRRKKFVPPPVSSKARSKAKKHVRKGVRYFKKGKRRQALEQYEAALALDPGNLDALFNSAAELAYKGQGEEAVERIHRLVDIGTKPAIKRVNKTRTDPDFEPIHDYVPYKRVSGFAKLKIVNSLGEYGEDEVDRIHKTLEKLDYPVAKMGEDKVKNRKTPVVWFKEHSIATAYMVKEVTIHPGTVMTRIDWPSEYDVIVSWGNKLVKREGVKQPQRDYTDIDPDGAEKRLDRLRQKQDKALRKPDQIARKINHTIDTPDRIENKIEGSIDRTKRTIDRIEKTGDKLQGIFK